MVTPLHSGPRCEVFAPVNRMASKLAAGAITILPPKKK
jgi:hypothetical protein